MAGIRRRRPKVAPFHLLASEGESGTTTITFGTWDLRDRVAAASDDVVVPTPWRMVALGDEAACLDAIGWWETLTGDGGEGMVVKPRTFICRGARGLIQPALKVRGRAYLRIIYGPEYDAPENLVRLRERGLGGKRALALREFALGHEALEAFCRARAAATHP